MVMNFQLNDRFPWSFAFFFNTALSVFKHVIYAVN